MIHTRGEPIGSPRSYLTTSPQALRASGNVPRFQAGSVHAGYFSNRSLWVLVYDPALSFATYIPDGRLSAVNGIV